MAESQEFKRSDATVLIGAGAVILAVVSVPFFVATHIPVGGWFAIVFFGGLGLIFVALGVLPLAFPSSPGIRYTKAVDILPVTGEGYILETSRPDEKATVKSIAGRMILIARPESIPILKADAALWHRVVNANDIPSFDGGDHHEFTRLQLVAGDLFKRLGDKPAALAVMSCKNPNLLISALEMFGLDRAPVPRPHAVPGALRTLRKMVETSPIRTGQTDPVTVAEMKRDPYRTPSLSLPPAHLRPDSVKFLRSERQRALETLLENHEHKALIAELKHDADIRLGGQKGLSDLAYELWYVIDKSPELFDAEILSGIHQLPSTRREVYVGHPQFSDPDSSGRVLLDDEFGYLREAAEKEKTRRLRKIPLRPSTDESGRVEVGKCGTCGKVLRVKEGGLSREMRITCTGGHMTTVVYGRCTTCRQYVDPLFAYRHRTPAGVQLCCPRCFRHPEATPLLRGSDDGSTGRLLGKADQVLTQPEQSAAGR